MNAARKIGIQGARASACDEAASKLVHEAFSSIYLLTALRTLEALHSGEIDAAVLAWESPLGSPVAETASAIQTFPVHILSNIDTEVRHCLLISPGLSASDLKHVASHEVPLRKHRKFLRGFLGEYQEIPLEDTGAAAEKLGKNELPPGTAVIALPQAAKIFGLEIVPCELPANDRYLTRFALVERGLA